MLHAAWWLVLLHHLYVGPVFSQTGQTFQPGANGPPVNLAPVIGSRTGGMRPDGAFLYLRWRF